MPTALPWQEQGTALHRQRGTGGSQLQARATAHCVQALLAGWPRAQDAKPCPTPEPSDSSSASKCGWTQQAQPTASSSLAWPQLAALGSLGAAREGRAGGGDVPGTGHRTREAAWSIVQSAVEGLSLAMAGDHLWKLRGEQECSCHPGWSWAPAAAGRAQPESRNCWAGGTISSSSPVPTERPWPPRAQPRTPAG